MRATNVQQSRGPRTSVALTMLVALCLGFIDAAQGQQAQLPWWERAAEAKVGHYWFKTDLAADEANALARHMNIMYDEYARRLAKLPQRAPEQLNVLIFESQDDYIRVLRVHYGVNAQGTGGMFFVTSQGSGLAFFTGGLPQRRVEHVMQHEGFHQFAWSRFGGDLPPWVNEGLAEFFGESILVGDKLVIGQSNKRVIDTIKEAIEREEFIDFRTMLTMDGQTWNAAVSGGSAMMQYNQAWSMIHFLVYGDDGRYVAAFEGYLRLLNQGVPSEDAFVRAFGSEGGGTGGADIAGFQRQWVDYAKNARPSSFVTALERGEFLAEGLVELKKRGVYPKTLDELKAQLRDIRFTYSLDRHGLNVTFDANDDALFTIPQDDLTSEQPVFELKPFDALRQPLRVRKLEETDPTPASIETKGLKPRRLSVEWERDKKTNELRYVIRVR
jgi:hypothetical protein